MLVFARLVLLLLGIDHCEKKQEDSLNQTFNKVLCAHFVVRYETNLFSLDVGAIYNAGFSPRVQPT